MSGYPIVLNLKGKIAVVVGGGAVAARKVKGLLVCNADVVVVAPDVNEKIEHFISTGRVRWVKSLFYEEVLQGANIIVAATNDMLVNERVYRAKSKDQLVNIVDNPSLSDFHVPATIRRGKLMITVSTDGASPSFAKQLRKELEKQFDVSYEAFLEFLFEVRKIVSIELQIEDHRKAVLSELSSLTLVSKPIEYLKQLANEKIAYYKEREKCKE